jgi:hypothetical protein
VWLRVAQMWLNYLTNFSHECLGSGPQAVVAVVKKDLVVSNTMFDNFHLQAAGYPGFQRLFIGYNPVRTTRDNRIACYCRAVLLNTATA